jgi:2-haloacid dehalogenase
MILNELLEKHNVTGLTEAEKDDLNRVWHRLAPWPDAISGLERLRKRFVVATLSNGNMALLTNMAKHSGIPWDCILSSELVMRYKPDPEVYQTAADLLGLPPEQVLMVAAHKSDLNGAKAAGLRTAYVPRPLEFGPDVDVDCGPDPAYDVFAEDFNALADRLGV